MLTLKTPAKINLTLEILGKRPDGYHEVRTVLQSVGLYDTINLDKERKTTITADVPGWDPGASLISRAVELLRKTTGYKRGAAISVEKRIPLLSGLGGDSSDAAAVLRGLNQLWELELPAERLQALAAQLGSDVTFFLAGGTALAEGRGENVTMLPPFNPRRWVVLMLPELPVEPGKTAQMYASLKPEHFSDGQTTRRLVEVLVTGRPFRSSMMVNTFENVAFMRESVLSVYREHILKLGAPSVHLAGSGPALFTLADDKDKADDLAVRCLNQGIRAHVVSTL